MTRFRLAVLLAATLLPLHASTAAEPPTLESDDEKTFYALGLALAKQLAPFQLEPADVSRVQAGLADGALGRAARVPLEDFGPKIDALMRERLTAAAEREKSAGRDYLAAASTEEGATRTESGMLYIERAAGEGASPVATDTVRVSYRGTFRDGSQFDRSPEGEPASFALSAVAPCFAEGIQRMKVGGKSRLVCPSDLAYGDQGFPPVIPPGATLVFEVELMEILGSAAETATP